MGRRGESIFKRKDGRWEARYKNGFTKDGSIRYRSVYGKTYSEAKEKRRNALRENYSPRSEGRFSEVITQWLKCKEADVKASTIERYRQTIDAHIKPFFGEYRCSAITPDLVEQFLVQMKKSGRLDGRGGLSQNSIRIMGILLQSLLAYAYQNKLGVNSLIKVKKPKPEKKRICVLNCKEQQRMDTLLLRNPHKANLAIYLALHTGLRIGEVCALKWKDVDFYAKQLQVRASVMRGRSGILSIGQPKSTASARNIPLTDNLTEMLLNEKKQSSSDFIFVSPRKGDFLDPRTLQYQFESFLKKNHFPTITFHALRHTFATRWIECGMDIKSLSEVLGHTSVQITLDIYVHSSDKMKRDAIEQIEKINGQKNGQVEAGSVA